MWLGGHQESLLAALAIFIPIPSFVPHTALPSLSWQLSPLCWDLIFLSCYQVCDKLSPPGPCGSLQIPTLLAYTRIKHLQLQTFAKLSSYSPCMPRKKGALWFLCIQRPICERGSWMPQSSSFCSIAHNQLNTWAYGIYHASLMCAKGLQHWRPWLPQQRSAVSAFLPLVAVATEE